MASTILSAVMLATCPAVAQPVQYNVPAQPLEAALIEFAEEARLSFDYSDIELSGLMSRGTSGHLSKEVSLRAILEGTGISYRFLSDSTVQLYRKKARPAVVVARSAPDTARGQSGSVVEEMVVTAVKRPAQSFDLPVSVTGVSALDLDDWGASDMQTLAPLVAGFSTTNLGPGRNKIFVRGLSDGPFADRTQALVGVYIDETPVNLNDTNPDIRLFDVDRVELVRGPQGTLYGAGALGGLYRIITNKPVLDETSARLRFTGSTTRLGGENGLAELVFNTPIVSDKLGFRVSGYVEMRDGYIDNIETGETNVNDLSIYGVRPAIRWQMADEWIFDLSATQHSIKYEDSQYYFGDLGRNQKDNPIPEPYDDDFFQIGATVQGRVAGMTLTSATSYVDRTMIETSDASDGLPFFEGLEDFDPGVFVRGDISQFGGASEFLELFGSDAVAYFSRDDIHTFSHETRLQSDTSARFKWLVGVYHLNRRQRTDSALVLAFVDEDGEIALTEDRLEKSEELALFGEAVYHISDGLSLTGGARLSRNKLSLEYQSLFALNGEMQAVTGKKVTAKLTPKVALMYQWSDAVQTYAQMSTGYRVGGLNINTPLDVLIAGDPDEPYTGDFVSAYQSDQLINFELGIKSYWFKKRLALNASVFRVSWYDIQSDQLGPSGLPFVTNVGNARSLGYEVELEANLVHGFDVRATYFWNDAKLLDDNSFLGALKGDRLPAIAERSLSLSAIYETELQDGWLGTLSADYAYTGESALAFNEDGSALMGDFGIVNARAQIAKGPWRLGFFIENLTDTQANTFAFGNGFSIDEKNQITPPRPRTIGLFVERRF